MDIDAGELRHRISFVVDDSQPNSNGFRIPSRRTVYSCRAKWQQESGKEVANRDGDYSEERGVFIIRYHAGLTRKMLVEYKNKDYEIKYIDTYNGLPDWLKISVARTVQGGDLT